MSEPIPQKVSRSVHRHLKWPLTLLWRLLVLIVGLALVLAGVVMIVTPGPAIVFIPLGLGVLATEFQWARNILQKVRPMIHAAIDKAKRKTKPSDQTTDDAAKDGLEQEVTERTED